MLHHLYVENAIGDVNHSQAKLHALVALAKQKKQVEQKVQREQHLAALDSGNSFAESWDSSAALHRSLDAHHKQVARHTDCAGNPVLDNLGCLNDQRNLANLNIVPGSVVDVVAQAAAEQELVEALVALLEAAKPQEPELAVSKLPLALAGSQAEQRFELELVLELLALGESTQLR